MEKFLVEVPHDPDTLACARVVKIFLETGSHYVSHADWGCRDGVHKAWMVIEADSHDEARMVVPPPFREEAHIVRLNRFSMDEIDQIIAEHS